MLLNKRSSEGMARANLRTIRVNIFFFFFGFLAISMSFAADEETGRK